MPLKSIGTAAGPLEYTVSSSFRYRFSRYLVLPRISESEEFRSGQRFQLSPMIQEITDEYLTQEEPEATYLKPSGNSESVFNTIRRYVRFVGKQINAIEVVERGWYRMPSGEQVTGSSDDEIDEEIAEEAGPTTDG